MTKRSNSASGAFKPSRTAPSPEEFESRGRQWLESVDRHKLAEIGVMLGFGEPAALVSSRQMRVDIAAEVADWESFCEEFGVAMGKWERV